MSKFWDRRAKVIIAREVPFQAIQINTPIHMSFKIQKKVATLLNTCEITITNLSPPTRGSLQKDSAEFELYAGYAHDLPTLPLMFHGTARSIDHRREGANWNTVIQSLDGDSTYRFANINKSWAPGTSTGNILQDLAQSLTSSGVEISSFLKLIPNMNLTKNQFVTGFAVSSNPYDELVNLIAPDGWVVSIQNGVLQVVKQDGSTPKEAPLISPQSGLIGSPSFGAPDHAGRLSELKIKSFLLPKLNPGDPFIVKSEGVNGKFVAEDVMHHGDTHSGPWFTEISSRSPIE